MQVCIENFDFRTELDVKNFLESEARKLGCKPSFDTIVASGKNASMPHYSGNGRLNRGFCVIDFGIRHKGYCSDMTRTIYLGSPSAKEKELYSRVRQAQQNGIDAVKEGAVAERVDSAARSALGKHKKAFIHGLGHHIGIEVHDTGQRISPHSKWLLKEGMTVTIEPGIYYRGKLGIRIEDDVLVRKNGCELLTKTGKELYIV
ncbi:M24 family metallopeptidase [Candidatus Woesearchaeota archaeon]|nr:M24 family metallopeptidase [Candidatus Woesearchaeota archaeon]